MEADPLGSDRAVKAAETNNDGLEARNAASRQTKEDTFAEKRNEICQIVMMR